MTQNDVRDAKTGDKMKRNRETVSSTKDIYFSQTTLNKYLKNEDDIFENKQIIKTAYEISKRSSNSLVGIEDQRIKQIELDKKMKMAGCPGKRSLLKNFILRNNLLPEQQGTKRESTLHQSSSSSSLEGQEHEASEQPVVK